MASVPCPAPDVARTPDVASDVGVPSPPRVPSLGIQAVGRELGTLLAELEDGENWRFRALCAQTDPEAHFPEKGQSPAAAKRTCAACGVRTECLNDALDNKVAYGVWGGASERERRRMLRERAEARLAVAA